VKWRILYHDEKLQADVLALPPGILARYFHCTDRKIVMLHQFVKKTDKTPPKELALARKRMKEWKHADA
jgi:hypothetical protein